jgi:hypothetical protein
MFEDIVSLDELGDGFIIGGIEQLEDFEDRDNVSWADLADLFETL